MPEPRSPNCAEERPVFPFDILWAGYGNAKVTLRDLAGREAEFRAFAEVAATLGGDVPYVTEDQVAQIALQRGLGAEQAHACWLICCFYLAPKQASAFGLDPKASRRMLLRAAEAASQFERALGSLAPKVLAALYFIRPTISALRDPKGGPFHTLQEEVADFAAVARAVAGDLTAADGRPRNHERDTMLRLFLETLDDGGFSDLKISSGTKTCPDPHLYGTAGSLLVELVGLVEPGWRVEWLAPRVKSVRAKMRKKGAAGGKTSES